MKNFIELFHDLRKHEQALIHAYRAKGKLVCSPIYVILTAALLLYLISPIDILPEGKINNAVAYVDDLLILLWYIFSYWRL